MIENFSICSLFWEQMEEPDFLKELLIIIKICEAHAE